MASGVIMPRQGQSVESCIITNWNVKEGDMVNEGDVLFEYETDKSAFEEEAQTSGMILKILAEEGDDVPCLDVVCVIGNEGEDISEFLTNTQTEDKEEVKETKKEIPESTNIISAGEVNEEKISPRAKMMAEEKHLDLTKMLFLLKTI